MSRAPWSVGELIGVQAILLLHALTPSIWICIAWGASCCCCCCWGCGLPAEKKTAEKDSNSPPQPIRCLARHVRCLKQRRTGDWVVEISLPGATPAAGAGNAPLPVIMIRTGNTHPQRRHPPPSLCTQQQLFGMHSAPQSQPGALSSPKRATL